MANTFFVTGTDTGVGKTLVTAALLKTATDSGIAAFALKPIAAGCDETEDGLRNEDALLIEQFNGVRLSYSQINPIALRAAKAPHIAAAEEGRRLSVDRIEGLVRGSLMQRAELKFIEGAGGWRIPLAPGEELAQLPQRLSASVILVVGMRLGCLNHALLTAQAIGGDGLPIAGWVANCLEEDMPSLQENIATLEYCLDVPCLGKIPFLAEDKVVRASQYLSLEPLLPVSAN